VTVTAGLVNPATDPTCHAAAEPLFERALKFVEATLGADHPNTRTVCANLDGLREGLEDQGAVAER
jgi:hypothetical protein